MSAESSQESWRTSSWPCFAEGSRRGGGWREDGEDFVGEVFGVPEVDFEHVLENFGDAALLADDDGDVVGEPFEQGDAERVRETLAHDVDVGSGEGAFEFRLLFRKPVKATRRWMPRSSASSLSSSTMSPLPAMMNLTSGSMVRAFGRP